MTMFLCWWSNNHFSCNARFNVNIVAFVHHHDFKWAAHLSLIFLWTAQIQYFFPFLYEQKSHLALITTSQTKNPYSSEWNTSITVAGKLSLTLVQTHKETKRSEWKHIEEAQQGREKCVYFASSVNVWIFCDNMVLELSSCLIQVGGLQQSHV